MSTKISAMTGGITPISDSIRQQAKQYLSSLAMPHWSLGQLMDLAEDLAAITGDLKPTFARKVSVVMAGDHGITQEGVSLFPQSVTIAILKTMLKGGAAINTLAKQVGSKVLVADLGVNADLSSLQAEPSFRDLKVAHGTGNILHEPAMTREQAELSLWNGFSLASELSSTADIMGIGELGIGNTTPATIIACASCHLSPKLVTGRGTGLSDEALKHKIDIIEKVIQNRSPNPVDGLDLLMNVGGYEIGGMAGFILGCAKHKKPVIIDGLICTAAAVIAHLICPTASQYVIAAHLSQEPAQAAMLKLLDKRPLLDLSLRLGEGTGAALAMPLVDCAQGLLCDMMTLEDAMAL